MEKLVINGGKPLQGEVTISGAKNAALAIVAATILCDEPCVLENVPEISDVRMMAKILRLIGAEVDFPETGVIVVDSKNVKADITIPDEITRKLRASYYLLGALLSNFGKACVALPGGCYFGVRPIDQHIKGFELLGANVTVEKGTIYAKAKKLKGAPIYMDIVSVGATMNIGRPRILWDVLIPQTKGTLIEMMSYFFVNSMMTISAVSFLMNFRTMPLSLLIPQLESQSFIEGTAMVSLLILVINLVEKGIAFAVKKKVAKEEEKILDAMKPDYIKGFSLLGGEPFEPRNQAVLCDFLPKIKAKYPEKTIWCYTGFTIEEIREDPNLSKLLQYIDVLVDGPYVEALRNTDLPFRGSTNQRIIAIKKYLKGEKDYEWH